MLRPAKSLPEDYHLLYAVDLSKQFGLLLALNFAGLGLLLFSGWAFYALACTRFPDLQPLIISTAEGSLFSKAFSVLIGFTAALALHELVHGAFFLWFTGERPRFGLSAAYAYAAAPEWYLPRTPYLVVGVTPIIVISLFGIAILPVLPRSALLLWWTLLTVNAGGAIGDLYVVARLIFADMAVMVNDQGDRIEVHAPRNPHSTSKRLF